MKIFTSILIFLAFSLVVFDATYIDFSHPFQGNSFTALITVAASFCAVLILLIFKMSKKIEEKMNDKQ